MKAEGLGFLEAVQALKDGKCKAITRPSLRRFYAYNYEDIPRTGTALGDIAFDHLLATDWQLIDPVPEKRTVKGWVNLIEASYQPRAFQCSDAYCSKVAAMGGRICGAKYLGDPLYIEHEYEVKP